MATPTLIGSRALHYWFSDFPLKQDADWDVISDKQIEGTEWHHPGFLNNASIAEVYESNHFLQLPCGTSVNVMRPEGLAIIKRSHLWRDLSFNKHVTHYHKYLKPYFKDNEIYQERLRLTKKEFPQGNPNLMQSKEDFFNDAVKKKYDHDYLHELVAFYDKPLYTRLLRQEGLAWCEKDKWNLLSEGDKLKCVVEEVQVIAIERFMIPTDWCYNSKRAYFKALQKVCTTLCSGWFRDFAIDNYPDIISLYDSTKFKQVQSTLEGEINVQYA